jgi:hypothetical protein
MELNSEQDRPSFLAVALRPTVVRRALGYALVVGALLGPIKQGAAIVAGAISGKVLWKIGLTVCVPYCVSTASSVGAIRNLEN